MKKAFLSNILFLVFINLLIKPFYIFGIDRTIQNRVGEEAYGLYATLFGFAFLMQIINDFGIQNYNNRTISQDPELVHSYVPNLIAFKAFLSIGFIIFVFIAGLFTGYAIDYTFFLLAICAIHILNSFLLYLRSNISGLGLYRTDSIISALDKSFLIILCAVLLWGNITREPFQIEWFVYAQITSLSITCAIAFWVICGKLKDIHIVINISFWKSIIRESYPYALVIFLMTVYSRVDIVMIDRLLANGQQETGIYAAAYRLLDAFNMIGFLFAGLLLPMFARMLKNKERVNSLVTLSLQIVWAGAITVAISSFFFCNEIMELLYTDATPYYGRVMRYLILSFIAMSGTYIYGTLLTANGSMLKMNRIFIITILLNVLLNFFLIPSYKCEGAAIATVATQFFALLAQILIAQKEINLQTDWKLVGRIGLFTISVIILSYSLYHYQYEDWIVKFAANIIGSLGLAFLFRLIDVPMFTRILKEKL